MVLGAIAVMASSTRPVVVDQLHDDLVFLRPFLSISWLDQHVTFESWYLAIPGCLSGYWIHSDYVLNTLLQPTPLLTLTAPEAVVNPYLAFVDSVKTHKVKQDLPLATADHVVNLHQDLNAVPPACLNGIHRMAFFGLGLFEGSTMQRLMDSAPVHAIELHVEFVNGLCVVMADVVYIKELMQMITSLEMGQPTATTQQWWYHEFADLHMDTSLRPEADSDSTMPVHDMHHNSCRIPNWPKQVCNLHWHASMHAVKHQASHPPVAKRKKTEITRLHDRVKLSCAPPCSTLLQGLLYHVTCVKYYPPCKTNDASLLPMEIHEIHFRCDDSTTTTTLYNSAGMLLQPLFLSTYITQLVTADLDRQVQASPDALNRALGFPPGTHPRRALYRVTAAFRRHLHLQTPELNISPYPSVGHYVQELATPTSIWIDVKRNKGYNTCIQKHAFGKKSLCSFDGPVRDMYVAFTQTQLHRLGLNTDHAFKDNGTVLLVAIATLTYAARSITLANIGCLVNRDDLKTHYKEVTENDIPDLAEFSARLDHLMVHEQHPLLTGSRADGQTPVLVRGGWRMAALIKQLFLYYAARQTLPTGHQVVHRISRKHRVHGLAPVLAVLWAYFLTVNACSPSSKDMINEAIQN